MILTPDVYVEDASGQGRAIEGMATICVTMYPAATVSTVASPPPPPSISSACLTRFTDGMPKDGCRVAPKRDFSSSQK